jgi:hypothetical protein
MAIELAPVQGQLPPTGALCVCRHGVMWHGAESHQCTYGDCDCWRYRPAIATDGQDDGSWHKGAETGGSMVADHPFIAPPGEPWERCMVVDEFERPCGLARSAHVHELEPYAPDTPGWSA